MSKCRECGDELKGHDDDGVDICRWCSEGWKPCQDEGKTADVIVDQQPDKE